MSVRVRAAIAGGLALGLGAGFTLASWNDAEFAKATFSASRFGTQSSLNGGAYADNATAPGATVALSGMVPNSPVYTMVRIRTNAQSVVGTATLGGAVMSGTGGTLLGQWTQYRVVRVDPAATCDATAFAGTPNWVVGAADTAPLITTGQNSGVTNVLAAATSAAPGTATAFCFQTYLALSAPTTTQSLTGTAVWTFTTRST
ncbi:SipW-dependent-type signal peptide-containing protein [Schumannella soli]|uniref:SipW-dependent-type signal peptide-containing protein n=1 Tax=Schumannella soli TaxID=2590779 RepID=UPI0015E874C7|nr:SipW-dependent-type signal peptide-containing protein [Schumannella soli]